MAIRLAILIPLAYLLGSIPFGLIVALRKGIDPRKSGSGNIGATNVGRLIGAKYFALVFTLDFLKGFAPALVGFFIYRGYRGFEYVGADQGLNLLWLLAAAAAVTGHLFSVFLNFKGGKGVATSSGMIFGIFPFYTLPALVAVATWGALFYATRYVSLSSIVGAIVFPLAYVALGLLKHWRMLDEQLPFLLMALLIASMLVYRHRGNIARLRSGAELRIGKP